MGLDTGSGGVKGSTGATDNSVLRADGTGGALVQNTPNVTFGDTGKLIFGNAIGSTDIVTLFSNITIGIGSGTIFFGAPAAGGFQFAVNLTTKLRIEAEGEFTLNRTITAAATTGNQTINKPAGTVNIAAAGTTVTVTNSLVTTSSIVFAVIRTNDGTATIKNVVAGAGSFVITLTAAATAEVSIGFWVTN